MRHRNDQARKSDLASVSTGQYSESFIYLGLLQDP